MSESNRQVIDPWTDQDKSLFKLLDMCADIRSDGSVRGPSGRGRVLLVGETQCGKTTLLRYWAEKLRGVRIVQAYCGTDSAEDIAGWPVRDTTSAEPRLSFTNPSVIPHDLLRDPEMDGKWVLYLDEVDKTPADVLSVLLSVIGDNRLRDTIIKPLAVVLAANPFLRAPHPALLSRVIGVPYPPKGYDLMQRPDLAYLKNFVSDVTFEMGNAELWPDRRTPPGTAHRLAKWIRTKPFWADHQIMDWVLEGSCSATDAASIRARMRDIPTDPPVTWAENADPSEIASGLIWNLVAQDAEVGHRVQEVLHKRASADVTGEMARVLDAFYGQRRVQAALEPHQGESDQAQRARQKGGQELMYKRYQKLQKGTEND